MNMREFLKEINELRHSLSEDAILFLDDLIQKNNEEPLVTENGQKILKAMLENKDTYLNVFSSKQLGEILFMSARSVSGATRKLITEGYVEKIGVNPVTYRITEKGENLVKDF